MKERERIIRTEAGLEYRVEKNERRIALFDNRDDPESVRLREAYGGEERFVCRSMGVWKKDLKPAFKEFLASANAAYKRLEQANAYEKFNFFRPREYWIEFKVELGEFDRKALVNILMDGFAWKDEQEEFCTVFYSPPPSYPIDFVFITDFFVRCGGSESTAAGLGAVVSKHLREERKLVENVSLTVVEVLYRFKLYVADLWPAKKEVGIISIANENADRDEMEIGMIAHPPFWMLRPEEIKIEKL